MDYKYKNNKNMKMKGKYSYKIYPIWKNLKSIKVSQKHPLNQLQLPKAERTKGESNLHLHGKYWIYDFLLSILRGSFAIGWILRVCASREGKILNNWMKRTWGCIDIFHNFPTNFSFAMALGSDKRVNF